MRYTSLFLASSFLILASCSDGNFSSNNKSETSEDNPDIGGEENGEGFHTPTVTTGEDAILSSSSSVDILDQCAKSEKKEKAVQIDFAADTKGCEWGINGNANRSSAIIAAMEVMYQGFSAPEAQAVCGMSISAKTPTFTIDDEAVFTLASDKSPDDYLLYSDWFPIRAFRDLKMKLSNEVVIFDRLKVIGWPWRGKGYSSPQPECGAGVVCNGISRRQTGSGLVGALDFKMGADFLKNLPSDFLLAKNFKLGLWADGDDDSSDCKYSAISFNVEIEYLPKK